MEVLVAKLSILATRAALAPVRSVSSSPDTITAQGGAGFSRDAKSELYLLAVTNMVSEKTFYESAGDRDSRFEQLIAQVALEDPDWIARFVPFLRNTLNMRSASIVMAAELVHAKLTQPVPASKIHNRDIIASAIVRADEPAEMLGYWRSRFGKNLPQPIKRALSEAATRLYTERNVIKWDGGDHKIQFADVIELVHPEPKAPWQDHLFHQLLDERHDHGKDVPGDLRMLTGFRQTRGMSAETFRSLFANEFVESNGLTWETASSKYGALDAKFWEAMIPNMGYMALLRNLRNFDEAKIGAATTAAVMAKLCDPEEVAKSRQFPIRLYSAWKATDSLNWGSPLEIALALSLLNVPVLKGKTLIMVDVSGSMDDSISAKSTVKRSEIAGVFGSAIALRSQDPSLWVYNNSPQQLEVPKSAAVIRMVDGIRSLAARGGGTSTWVSVLKAYTGQDRIIILTDEQTSDTYGQAAGISKPIYIFNVAGYKAGSMPSGEKQRYVFGGLTDAAFTAIELLEAGHDASWPF